MPLDTPTISAIEEARDMQIEKSWNIAYLAQDKKIALIKFKPQPKVMLASLVVVLRQGFIFEDYVGGTEDETSVWRVGDGGEIYPESFKILCAFQTDKTIELVRSWSGFEGENIALLRAKGTSFERIKEAYRYWAPL